jgi:hypothetical protein
MQSKSRFYFGLFIFILGFLSPLAIPLCTENQFVSRYKNRHFRGFGCWRTRSTDDYWQGYHYGERKPGWSKPRFLLSFKPLAPPMFVSKPRFYFGISLFALCLLESVVHVHWDGIVNWYADFALAYMIFWNVLFLLSLYIFGGDFFNRLIGLFLFRPNSKS